MAAPLEGIRVLDVATMVAAPYGATMLGDMGADVIKVEPPYGDDARHIGPGVGNDSGIYIGTNRNKRGIALDMTKTEGQAIFRKLVETADIVIDNFRPAAKEKLGLSYEKLSAIRPDIITISVSTYGNSGPLAGKPGIDPAAQAITGAMSITGEPDGRPLKTGVAIADATAANLVAYAAMVALWTRANQGIGQPVEISLIDGMLHIQPVQTGQYFSTGYLSPPLGNGSAYYAPYETFTCRDGRAIQVAAFTDKFFRNLCIAIENEALVTDPRFLRPQDRLDNVDELHRIIQQAFSRHDGAEMNRRLQAVDTVAAPVNTLAEAFAEPQVINNQMVVEIPHQRLGKVNVTGLPVKLRETPGAVRLGPPVLGQHTEEVLSELGLTESQIAELKTGKIIKTP